MKYYVILLVTYNNGTADKKAIYEFDSETEAVANFHTNVGIFMKDTNVQHLNVMAINNNGGIYQNEVFDRGEE